MVKKGDTFEPLDNKSSTKGAETDKVKVEQGVMIKDVKNFNKLICS